jgi:DcuC family C4-dicarboxylate transporter
MILLLGLFLIALAVFLVLRGLEVRLVLTVAALLLGLLAGNPWAVVTQFLATMADGKFIIPICSAMGFVYVLKQARCDEHLVHLLTKPLHKVRVFIIPGTVLVGFFVNIPIISQTSTALVVGTVLIPLLRAARISPLTSGAALLLGASMGGELLNPGAPELITVAEANHVESQVCVAHVAELLPLYLPVVVVVFWLLSLRAERQYQAQLLEEKPVAETAPFQVQIWKAVIPLLPVVFLFLAGPPFNLLPIRTSWLMSPKEVPELALLAKTDPAAALKKLESLPQKPEMFNSRLIGFAMLLGVVCAALASWQKIGQTATAFFEGAGYGYIHIISLIVAASAFGEGVKQLGLDRAFGELIKEYPSLLIPAAALLPWALAFISGSGMASTNALYRFFVEPAQQHGWDPLAVGALVSLSAGAGRTMSAVAAVTLMCAKLTDTKPLDLVKRVAPPLLFGLTVVVCWLMMRR